MERAFITCNKNGVPFDPEKPMITSGVRLGTPAATSRGFGVVEFQQVGDLIAEVLDCVAANGGEAVAGKRSRGEGQGDRLVPAFPDLRLNELSMRCPYCSNSDTQVKDSRPTEDSTVIRRRRHCTDCGGRFTTFERIQLRELIIVKNSGRKVPFDRDKLMRSVQIALRKRPVEQERVERMVSGIVRRMENLGEAEIPAKMLGEMVMEGLFRP